MAETYEIKLENFTGPIDLLLHLINANKMDIFSLDLHIITRQYLEAVTRDESAPLENAYYFLLMASTLLEIKSRLLLPTRAEEQKPGEPTGEEMKADLVRRLQTYKNLKDVVTDFAAREESQRKLLYPMMQKRLERSIVYSLKDVSLYDLLTAFEEVAGRVRPTGEVSYGDEDLSVDEVWDEIVASIGGKEDGALLTDVLSLRRTAYWFVVSFLTILELIHMGRLQFTRQGSDFKLSLIDQPQPAEEAPDVSPGAPSTP